VRILSYVGYTLAHHRLIGSYESGELETETTAQVVAFGAGATSFRGGFSIDHRALRSMGATSREASVFVIALGMFEYAVLAPAAWVCALLLLNHPHVQGAMTWPWLIGVPVGTALALAGYVLLPRRLDAARRGRRALLSRLIDAGDVLVKELGRPIAGPRAALGMALHWFAEIAALYAALRAFGVDPPVQAVVLAYATGYVLSPRGLPLAGAGIPELLLPLALMWVGVGLPTAVVAVLAAEASRLAVSLPLALVSRRGVREVLGQQR
jgi:voltage-gated potassium channel Kch